MSRSPFSDDYATARDRFCGAAHAMGLRQEKLPVDVPTPYGSDLSIDVAFAGSEQPSRVLIVTSGLHGVEGFFGSAIQVALLEDVLRRDAVPSGVSIVLVHALNPFGFFNIRRFDDENIDLNRNFLLSGGAFKGCPDLYPNLDGLLNPRRPPRRFDPFPIRFLLAIARYRLKKMKQAVAGGQYDYPLGLFFGGKGPSRTQTLLREQLPRWVGGAERVLHIDFHTGLGRWAEYELLLVKAMEHRKAQLAEVFGADKVKSASTDAIEARGDSITWCCEEVLRDRDYVGIGAEFGTYGVIRVLAALRAENQAHHWGVPHSPSTIRAKARLKEVFVPEDPAWRSETLAQGVKIVQRAIEFV
jgi:predicted deacylase